MLWNSAVNFTVWSKYRFMILHTGKKCKPKYNMVSTKTLSLFFSRLYYLVPSPMIQWRWPLVLLKHLVLQQIWILDHRLIARLTCHTIMAVQFSWSNQRQTQIYMGQICYSGLENQYKSSMPKHTLSNMLIPAAY